MNKLKRIGLYLLFFTVGNFFTAPVINGAQQLTPENIKRLMAVDSQETLLAYVRDFMDPNVTTINAPIANAVQALQQAYRAAQQGNTAIANQAVLTAEQNIQIGRGKTSPVATLEPRVQPENIAPIVKAIEEEVKVVQALAPEERKKRQAIQEQEIIQTKREEAPLLTQQRIPSPTPPITEEPLVTTSSAPRVNLGPEHIKEQTQLTQATAQQEARRLEALRIAQERLARLKADEQKAAAEAARLKQEQEDKSRALAQQLEDEQKAAEDARLKKEAEDRALAQRLEEEQKAAEAARLKAEAEDRAAAQKLADEERIAAEKAAEKARLKKEQEDKDRAAAKKLRKDTAATAADKAKEEAQEVLQNAQAGLQKILDQARTLGLDQTEDFKQVQEAVKNPNKTGSYIWAKKEAQLVESLMQSQALPQKNAEFKQRINSMRGIILPFERAVIKTLETSIEEADAAQKAKTRPAGPLWITHVPATTPTLPPVAPEPILPKLPPVEKPKAPAVTAVKKGTEIQELVEGKRKELDNLIQAFTELKLSDKTSKDLIKKFNKGKDAYLNQIKISYHMIKQKIPSDKLKEHTEETEKIKKEMQAFDDTVLKPIREAVKTNFDAVYIPAAQEEATARSEEFKQLENAKNTLQSLNTELGNPIYQQIREEVSAIKRGQELLNSHIRMVGKLAFSQHLIDKNVFKSEQDKKDALAALDKKEVIDKFREEVKQLLERSEKNKAAKKASEDKAQIKKNIAKDLSDLIDRFGSHGLHLTKEGKALSENFAKGRNAYTEQLARYHFITKSPLSAGKEEERKAQLKSLETEMQAFRDIQDQMLAAIGRKEGPFIAANATATRAANKAQAEAKKRLENVNDEFSKLNLSFGFLSGNNHLKYSFDELTKALAQSKEDPIPSDSYVEQVRLMTLYENLTNAKIFKSPEQEQTIKNDLPILRAQVDKFVKDVLAPLESKIASAAPAAPAASPQPTPAPAKKLSKVEIDIILNEANKKAEDAEKSALAFLESMQKELIAAKFQNSNPDVMKVNQEINATKVKEGENISETSYVGAKGLLALYEHLIKNNVPESDETTKKEIDRLKPTIETVIKNAELDFQEIRRRLGPAQATTFKDQGIPEGTMMRFQDLKYNPVSIELNGTAADLIKKLAQVFIMDANDLKILNQNNQVIPLTVQALSNPNLRNQTLLVVHKGYKAPSKKPAPAGPAPAAPQPQPVGPVAGGPVAAANDTFSVMDANVLNNHFYLMNFKPEDQGGLQGIKLEKRKATFTNLLTQFNPDVIALQELHKTTSPEVSNINNYYYVSDRGFDQIGFNLLLGVSKNKFHNPSVIAFEKFKTPGATKNGYVAFITQFKNNPNNIGIINTHLAGSDAPQSFKQQHGMNANSEFRKAQLNEILDFINQKNRIKYWILCGDLNFLFVPNGPADLWIQANQFAVNDINHTTLFSNDSTGKLDYILSKGLEQYPDRNKHEYITPLKDLLRHNPYDKEKTHFSDHATLFTRFKIPAAPAP